MYEHKRTLPECTQMIELSDRGAVIRFSHWYNIGGAWHFFEVTRIHGGYESKQGVFDGSIVTLRGTLPDVTAAYVNAEDLPNLFALRHPTVAQRDELGFGDFTVSRQRALAA